MPAPFARDLCGYRAANGNPNTSDNHDDQSKRLGRALFERLGVPKEQPGPMNPGADMETQVAAHLRALRPDLRVAQSLPAATFTQYRHLAVFRDFRRDHRAGLTSLLRLRAVIEELADPSERQRLLVELDRAVQTTTSQDELVLQLKAQMPEESLLKIDIAIGDPEPKPEARLHIALSSKWSLRTDRAQDCVSQGSRLVALRRGRMPHFAVVTMEPRPSMLKILGDGSGAIDCIYHLDLPALTGAMDDVAASSKSGFASPLDTFKRLIGQRRLRDYDELLDEHVWRAEVGLDRSAHRPTAYRNRAR